MGSTASHHLDEMQRIKAETTDALKKQSMMKKQKEKVE
jgi:hypothetical protein